MSHNCNRMELNRNIGYSMKWRPITHRADYIIRRAANDPLGFTLTPTKTQLFYAFTYKLDFCGIKTRFLFY